MMGCMDLDQYVEGIRHQLLIAADAGGDQARALAERLLAPLDAAVRLVVQDALSAAAEEITLEMVPGSVELRIRGGEPEFVVSLPPADGSDDGSDGPGYPSDSALPASGFPRRSAADDPALSRINLRLPDDLKSQIDLAAAREGLSVNAWLVRAAAAALQRKEPNRDRQPPAAQRARRYKGWAK
jgi:hypothetical protein